MRQLAVVIGGRNDVKAGGARDAAESGRILAEAVRSQVHYASHTCLPGAQRLSRYQTLVVQQEIVVIATAQASQNTAADLLSDLVERGRSGRVRVFGTDDHPCPAFDQEGVDGHERWVVRGSLQVCGEHLDAGRAAVQIAHKGVDTPRELRILEGCVPLEAIRVLVAVVAAVIGGALEAHRAGGVHVVAHVGAVVADQPGAVDPGIVHLRNEKVSGVLLPGEALERAVGEA